VPPPAVHNTTHTTRPPGSPQICACNVTPSNRHSQPGFRCLADQEIAHLIARHGQCKTASDHGVDADDETARVCQWAAGIARRKPDSSLDPGLGTEAANGSDVVNDTRGQLAHEA